MKMMPENTLALDRLPPDMHQQIVALLAHKDDIISRLEALVKDYKQALFGSKSEKADPDQYALAFEDIEVALAAVEAEEDKFTPAKERKQRHPNRGHLPKHFPRIEEVIEPSSTVCPCGGQMHVIGEDISERLDIIPAQFRVLVTRRPKYACRGCTDGVVQASAPEGLIPGGMPTEALVAHVLISKYADHLPLYRLTRIFGRQGIDLDRSTLAHWVGRASFELAPVFNRLAEHLKGSTKLFMDETTAPVLDPGRGRTKTGYMWVLARDDRPWGSDDPPGVACFYAPGRSGEYAETFLKGFSGVLQVDGYAGYNRLTKADRKEGPLHLALCWAHARRYFIKITKGGVDPIAEAAIKQIAALYRVEKNIRGKTPEERLRVRQAQTAPLIEEMAVWLESARAGTSKKSPIGKALAYLAKHWKGLTLFLGDGRIELDNNTVEREIRPVVMTRKSSLFAGHDEGGVTWGIIASLVGTCKLNNVNPQAWMTHTLKALVGGHKQSQIDELMPWNFEKITITGENEPE